MEIALWVLAGIGLLVALYCVVSALFAVGVVFFAGRAFNKAVKALEDEWKS